MDDGIKSGSHYNCKSVKEGTAKEEQVFVDTNNESRNINMLSLEISWHAASGCCDEGKIVGKWFWGHSCERVSY